MILSFHHIPVKEPVLLSCCAVSLGNFIPNYKEVYHLHLQVICQFTDSGINYSTTRCNNPRGLVPQHENRFEMHKIFQLSVIYRGYCAQVPHDLMYCNSSHILSAVSPPPTLSLSPCYTRSKKYGCVISALLIKLS